MVQVVATNPYGLYDVADIDSYAEVSPLVGPLASDGPWDFRGLWQSWSGPSMRSLSSQASGCDLPAPWLALDTEVVDVTDFR
jgi:hypothetical protein